MRRFLLVVLVAGLLAGCGGGSAPQGGEKGRSTAADAVAPQPVVQTASITVWTNYSLAHQRLLVERVENPDDWDGPVIHPVIAVGADRYRVDIELGLGAAYLIRLRPGDGWPPDPAFSEASVDLDGSAPGPYQVELRFLVDAEADQN